MLQPAHILTSFTQHSVMCNNKKCLIVYEFVKNLLKSAHKDMETNTAHSKFVTFVSKYNTWPS